MPTISLNGQPVEYIVRQSGRAKYLSLRIDSQRGLQVVTPKRAHISQADIDALLKSRADWILKHLTRMDNATAGISRDYRDGSSMPYLGAQVRLTIVPAAGERTSVRLDSKNAVFIVRVPDALRGQARIDAIREAFGRWYSKQAREHIPLIVEHWAQQMNLTIGDIRIKDQRTRWGSASSKNNLNFNRRLMMAPPAVIEYVVIHELCHFFEMNHSPRYWAHVATHCPDYKRLRKWLKANSAALQL